MTEREVQDIIDEVDENRDGKLDYQEVIKSLSSSNLHIGPHNVV